MPKKKASAAIVVLVVLVFLIAAAGLVTAAFSNLYYVRESSGGSLLWHADEAYLFLFVSRRGYRIRYIEYPLVVLGEYLYAPRFPDDHRNFLTVIRVTPSEVERRVVEFGEEAGTFPSNLTPFGEQIYAECPGVILCKWTGTDFKTATAEEQRDLDGIHRLDAGTDGEMNGWSKRGVRPAPHDQFAVEVGHQFTLSVKNGAVSTREQPKISIDLARPGKASETIWYHDGTAGNISEMDYENRFGTR